MMLRNILLAGLMMSTPAIASDPIARPLIRPGLSGAHLCVKQQIMKQIDVDEIGTVQVFAGLFYQSEYPGDEMDKRVAEVQFVTDLPDDGLAGTTWLLRMYLEDEVEWLRFHSETEFFMYSNISMVAEADIVHKRLGETMFTLDLGECRDYLGR